MKPLGARRTHGPNGRNGTSHEEPAKIARVVTTAAKEMPRWHVEAAKRRRNPEPIDFQRAILDGVAHRVHDVVYCTTCTGHVKTLPLRRKGDLLMCPNCQLRVGGAPGDVNLAHEDSEQNA